MIDMVTIRPDETLIFDLDGTLVDSLSFDDECFIEAIREILGDVSIRDDWLEYKHVTDAGIMAEVLSDNGIFATEEAIQDVKAAFGRRIADALSDLGSCTPIKGAIEFLTKLRTDGHRFGIATGGWRHTAEMKLTAAGFPLNNLTLSTSDDAPTRTGIMTNCLRQLDESSRRVVYFGDREWDQQATHELGWRFIGVGPRLHGQCKEWVRDFAGLV